MQNYGDESSDTTNASWHKQHDSTYLVQQKLVWGTTEGASTYDRASFSKAGKTQKQGKLFDSYDNEAKPTQLLSVKT